MDQVRIIAYGITLGSVMITSFVLQDPVKTIAASTQGETLSLVANGEDFVRQGFVSKDGWAINFEHVYVNLSDAIAGLGHVGEGHCVASPISPQT